MVIFNGISPVLWNRKFWDSVPNPPWKRKQLRILFRGTKIEAKRSKLSELPSKLFHRRENNWEFFLWNKNKSKLSKFHSDFRSVDKIKAEAMRERFRQYSN
jgi:hypothetical protein